MASVTAVVSLMTKSPQAAVRTPLETVIRYSGARKTWYPFSWSYVIGTTTSLPKTRTVYLRWVLTTLTSRRWPG